MAQPQREGGGVGPKQRQDSGLTFRQAEVAQVVDVLRSGQSLLVLGEPGSGKTMLAEAVATQLASVYRLAIAAYGGSAKQVLVEIAEALDVPTVTMDERARPLTAEQLRVELLDELKRSHRLLIVDDAHRWPSSLRYWLEAIFRAKGLLLVLADRPPAKDIFMKLPRIELAPLESDEIRSLMCQEALSNGVNLSPGQFAALQQRVGGNPALAKRVVREELLGFSEESSVGDHRQYIDGTPFLVAGLSAIGIVRFIGIGMGDKALYVVGGVASLLAIVLRTLFSSANRGSRTRLGR